MRAPLSFPCTETPTGTRPRSTIRLLLLLAVVFSVAHLSFAKDPVKLLAPRYQEWLRRDVAYIITNEERDAFLALPTDEARDYAGAEQSLNEGLKQGGSAEGLYELAKTYWALGRWQDAEPHGLRALALRPTMAPVHVILGNTALRKHDVPGALREYQEYLKLDPKGPMAEGAEAMVKKLQAGLNTLQ